MEMESLTLERYTNRGKLEQERDTLRYGCSLVGDCLPILVYAGFTKATNPTERVLPYIR